MLVCLTEGRLLTWGGAFFPNYGLPPMAAGLIKAASSAIDFFFSSLGDSYFGAGCSVALIFSEARLEASDSRSGSAMGSG